MNIYSVKIYWATEAICTSPGPQSSAFLVTRQYSVYLGERRCLMIRDQSLDSQLWYPKAVKYHRSEHTKSTKWSMRWNTETEADNLCRRHDCHGGKRRTGFYYRCHPSEEHGINQSKMEPPIVGCKDKYQHNLTTRDYSRLCIFPKTAIDEGFEDPVPFTSLPHGRSIFISECLVSFSIS